MRTTSTGAAIALVALAGGCEQEPSVTLGSLKTADALVNVASTAFSPPPRIGGLPGLACFDYDNDTDLDLLITSPPGGPNAFYRNDGGGNFTLVTEEAGLAFVDEMHTSPGVGDFDNDGWLDLVLCRQRFVFRGDGNDSVLLLRNLGPDESGVVRFEDVSERAGLAVATFGLSVGVADIDNDGLLDIYIGRFDIRDLSFVFESYLPDTPNVLLRNTGVVDGVPIFEDITAAAGVAGSVEAGLAPDTIDIVGHVPTWAVYFSDVNADGWQDLFVLHEVPGRVDLFMNNQDLTFTRRDDVALNQRGGWMSVASSDFDRDGDVDYFLANVGGDAFSFFGLDHVSRAYDRDDGSPFHLLLRCDGDGVLTNVAGQVAVTEGELTPVNALGGTGLASYEFGFGSAWLDMQNDGWPDLVWTGDIFADLGALGRFGFNGVGRYLQADGRGGFVDLTAERGLFNGDDEAPLQFGFSRLGRALAALDLNDDGFADVIRTNLTFELAASAFECLLNPGQAPGHWLKVRLEGTQSNRFGIGAKVEVVAGGVTQAAEIVTTTSVFTAVHPQAHFGLGDAEQVESLTIRWPSGSVSTRTDLAVDQLVTISESP